MQQLIYTYIQCVYKPTDDIQDNSLQVFISLTAVISILVIMTTPAKTSNNTIEPQGYQQQASTSNDAMHKTIYMQTHGLSKRSTVQPMSHECLLCTHQHSLH